MQVLLKVLYLSVLICAISAATCSNPPTDPNYSVQTYEGRWFQLAKFQTAGGAYFQRNCSCTQVNIKKDGSNVNAYQGCIRNGNRIMINATLVPTDTSGKYIQKIGPNSVGYWVIYLDSSYAVTYDCNTVEGITNYCIHVLSKNPHVDMDTISRLAQKALDLGLNKNNLKIEITNQSDSNCPRSFNIIENIINTLKNLKNI